MSLGETMTFTEITPATDRSKSRKFKAILAGGLVLGLGAAVTLAAWNDSEFVIGNFGNGHFKMVGSEDGTSFSNHDTSATADSLSFSLGYDNLSPDDTVAAPYVVHLDATSDYPATVSVEAATGSQATDKLRYKIIEVASVAACTPSATATPEETVVPTSSFNADPGQGSFELETSTNGTDAGPNVYLCIQVTADPELDQDETATATWQFVASSATAAP